MKLRNLQFVIGSLLLLFTTTCLAENNIPYEINGFRLGAPIEEYEFIAHQDYLREVMIDNIGGFRRGSLAYGTCDRPGEIVRIKLKYKNNSKKFYKQLLKRYKKKFGDPEEFTGDAFGIVLSWKWRFKDKDNNHISMTLQHNKKDLNEATGNMVKLSFPERIKAERKCFLNSCKMEKTERPASMMNEDWEYLIPK